MPSACYVKVYLDDVLLNVGRPTPGFDVNTLLTDQIEAIEFYAGAAELPMRYSPLNSVCGVLVIHTRLP
jgi:hypothetical protein